LLAPRGRPRLRRLVRQVRALQSLLSTQRLGFRAPTRDEVPPLYCLSLTDVHRLLITSHSSSLASAVDHSAP
jgi:hypothetical protein